jgi:hypothetical protein
MIMNKKWSLYFTFRFGDPDPEDRIGMFLGLLDSDPDPLVRGTDPDPDPNVL